MVVYCQAGVRSERARLLAVAAGYDGVKNYRGSWSEWSHHNPPEGITQ